MFVVHFKGFSENIKLRLLSSLIDKISLIDDPVTANDDNFKDLNDIPEIKPIPDSLPRLEVYIFSRSIYNV